MAEDPGARIVTCSKHGIPYDASKRGGCSRCIQEWERQKKASTESTGFPTSLKLLGLLLVVAGLYFVLNRQSGEDTVPSPAPAGEAAPASRAANPREARIEATLREIVDEVPELIQAGRTETESVLADSSDPERQKGDWEFWSLDWSSRVSQLIDRLPERPDSQSNMKLTLLYQEVNRAVRELGAVPETTQEDGLPDAGRVRQRFETAEKALQQARLYMAQLSQ